MFLVSAAVEGLASPLVGRIADRRGALLPIRVGLLSAALPVLVVPAPGVALLCAALR